MSDAKDAIGQMDKIKKEVEERKAAELKIQQEQEEIKQMRLEAERSVLENKVSKDEFIAALEELRTKNEQELSDMRSLLLKLKKQGKAHFEGEKDENDDEITKIYGNNRIISKIFPKK